MKTERQPKKSAAEALVGTQASEFAGSGNGPCVYLIRIAAKKDREKALSVFRRVQASRVRFPGNVMGVTEEHLHVLTTAKISFEYLSKAPHGEEKNATI